MCGISGCITFDENAMVSVINALNKLQNRGYDSAGVATIDLGKIIIEKYVSGENENAMKNLNDSKISKMYCNIALGHTRWATHGGKTLENAHPHSNQDGKICLVHNGIIENYHELKKILLDNSYEFYGETDSEIVAKYYDFLCKKNQANIEILNKSMKGSWAILILNSNFPDKIYYLKNGSPLLIGRNDDSTKFMFASELIGFDKDITQYASIIDGDHGSVSVNGVNSHLGLHWSPVPKMDVETSPTPHLHWTIKEIYDQSNAINDLLATRFVKRMTNYHISFPELDSLKTLLKNNTKHLHFIFLACGTSYHAAQIGAKVFKELGIKATMEIIDGADFEDTDIPDDSVKTILILLSQSGETKDLYRGLCIGKEHQITTIGIINVENSLIAREVDYCLYLKAGREHAVASTKSFTNQVLMLTLLALWLDNHRKNKPTPEEIEIYGEKHIELRKRYFDSIKNLNRDFIAITNQSIQEVPTFIDLFKGQDNCFLLGKQESEWIAKEGSLKIKEISYIHSEGYSTAALKHGPFALLHKNMPVIFIANNDRFYSKTENVTQEVQSRLASVIYITNKVPNISNLDKVFYFESDSILFPLLSIVPLQVLAYLLALNRGNNPDYPRHLAKVVTVE